MWPWDHLAVGYLAYSLWRRRRSGRPPTDAEAVAVALGTQFPDLVDKPLGWGTSLLPSGHSLAHSLVTALPVSVAVYLLARRSGRGAVGAAFALGYLSHLPGDVGYPVVVGGRPDVSFLLWPFLEIHPAPPVGLTGRVLELFGRFVAFLGTPRGAVFLAADATLLAAALALWWRDGRPGLGVVRAAVSPRFVYDR